MVMNGRAREARQGERSNKAVPRPSKTSIPGNGSMMALAVEYINFRACYWTAVKYVLVKRKIVDIPRNCAGGSGDGVYAPHVGTAGVFLLQPFGTPLGRSLASGNPYSDA